MSSASETDEMCEMFENADKGDFPPDGHLPGDADLPSPSDSVGKVKAVWGGVIGFIQQTLALYASMPKLKEEERRDLQYKWKQREAVDTSDSEERMLRVKYVLEYKEERERTDSFRAEQLEHMRRCETIEHVYRTEQLEHMRRCETIERERTDRIVATIRDGFSDVIAALKFEAAADDSARFI